MINAKKQLAIMEDKAEVLKAISHPIRLCIVTGLISEKGCSVSKIHDTLELPQSTVSQHIAKLKSAGIVEGTRKGLVVTYKVVNKDVINIINCFNFE